MLEIYPYHQQNYVLLINTKPIELTIVLFSKQRKALTIKYRSKNKHVLFKRSVLTSQSQNGKSSAASSQLCKKKDLIKMIFATISDIGLLLISVKNQRLWTGRLSE